MFTAAVAYAVVAWLLLQAAFISDMGDEGSTLRETRIDYTEDGREIRSAARGLTLSKLC
jgi:hypothetical protein